MHSNCAAAHIQLPSNGSIFDEQNETFQCEICATGAIRYEFPCVNESGVVVFGRTVTCRYEARTQSSHRTRNKYVGSMDVYTAIERRDPRWFRAPTSNVDSRARARTSAQEQQPFGGTRHCYNVINDCARAL